jgi:hypothetical protein
LIPRQSISHEQYLLIYRHVVASELEKKKLIIVQGMENLRQQAEE